MYVVTPAADTRMKTLTSATIATSGVAQTAPVIILNQAPNRVAGSEQDVRESLGARPYKPGHPPGT
ncbi:hypothetical protein MCNF_13880 [Mycolicibacterium confluentis]|uniref:Uncharacterized protein n=1 Tax=Mycolicibacterium confluentis TaxID=28047 RepID=A0A7I7XUN8_9MYCO|nr:hypothetical protein MCNF_13880 [Mycolicibacterium confluentis]